MLSLMAERVEVLRLEAAAATAGDRVRAHKLHAKRVGLGGQIVGVLGASLCSGTCPPNGFRDAIGVGLARGAKRAAHARDLAPLVRRPRPELDLLDA
jgi:hypothetical protein